MVEPWLEPFQISPLFQQVFVAFAIGGLIGLEREKEPGKFAGLRTLALLCGTAPLMIAVSEHAELPWLIGVYVGLAIVLALAIVGIRFILTGEDVGLTTSVTVVIVALLGLMVGYGLFFEATAVAIITAFLLAEKESMVRYVDNLTYRELTDSMKLGALVFILYPILPTEAVDPYGVLFLREVLLFAILVLLIEFSAYVSMRQLGASRGLQVTGLLAGMANSLATAGIMARMANRSRSALNAASSGLMLSVIAMIIRNVGLTAIIAIPLFYVLWGPALAMLALAVGVSALLVQRGDETADFEFDLESPFSFKAAGKFAAVYIVITVAAVIAADMFGDAGVLATAYFGGLASSAAVVVSAGSIFNQGTIGAGTGGGMVMLAIMGSLTAKIVLVELVNGEMRLRGILPMLAIGLVGLAVYGALRLLAIA